MLKIKETIPQKAAPQGRQSLAKLGALQSEIMMELTREKLTVEPSDALPEGRLPVGSSGRIQRL